MLRLQEGGSSTPEGHGAAGGEGCWGLRYLQVGWKEAGSEMEMEEVRAAAWSGQRGRSWRCRAGGGAGPGAAEPSRAAWAKPSVVQRFGAVPSCGVQEQSVLCGANVCPHSQEQPWGGTHGAEHGRLSHGMARECSNMGEQRQKPAGHDQPRD